MIESSSFRANSGVLIYFDLARYIRLDSLTREFEFQAVEDKFLPGARTPSSALKSALEECFSSRPFEVWSLKNRNAFEIVQIVAGPSRNEVSHHLWVGIDDLNRVDVQPYAFEIADKIVAAFNQHRGLISGQTVGQLLVNLIFSLGGTRLRKSGSVYWLPGDKLSRWRQIAGAVEDAECKDGKNMVYLIKHLMDEDEIKAVKDGLKAQIESDCEEIHKDVMSGKLKVRALEGRHEQAQSLREKLAAYEQLLQVSLGDLAAGLDKTEESIVAAQMLIAAGAPVLQEA